MEFKTLSANKNTVHKEWLLVDATDEILGRLASKVAKIIRGKYKSNYTPHVDCGDNIVIINAEKIQFSGDKLNQKEYIRHTGYPGGIKSRSAGAILDGNHPERVVEKAVERMISRNPLGRRQMKKLHVYAGAAHPHDAQQPEVLDVAAMNSKNKRSA